MSNGLRQGCILSPILISLYINTLVDEIKRAEVGVECRGQWIPALLYADDMVMFAEEEEGLVRGLKVLEEWCEKWSVKVNAEKCGIYYALQKEEGEEKQRGVQCEWGES